MGPPDHPEADAGPGEPNDGSPERTDELLEQSRELMTLLDAQLSTEGQDREPPPT